MKTLNIMSVKEEDVLNRDDMKNIVAGSGSGNCRIAVSNSSGFNYWSECVSVEEAQSDYNYHQNGGSYQGGNYASGYCCASCGSDDFSNADPCY